VDDNKIPRWQQGMPLFTYRDVWERMNPAERRVAFVSDLLVALVGAAGAFWIFL